MLHEHALKLCHGDGALGYGFCECTRVLRSEAVTIEMLGVVGNLLVRAQGEGHAHVHPARAYEGWVL